MKEISRNWTRENLAWVSGIFEGEGHFGINYRRNGKPSNFCAKITMTDEDVLQTFNEIVGMGSLTGPYPPKGNGKNRTAKSRAVNSQYPECNKSRKLTFAQEGEIKRLVSEGRTRKDLANQFNVSYSTIKRLAVGINV